MSPKTIPFALLVGALAGCGEGADDRVHGARALAPGPTSIAASRNIVYPAKNPELIADAGSDVTFTLQWEAAPLGEDLLVFVHFLDRDGVYAFGADYSPPEQTSTWSGHLEHVRTITVPPSARGTYLVRVGLYEQRPPWGRAPLNPGAGVVVDDELRYQVASLTVRGSDKPTTELRASTVLPAENQVLSAAPGESVALTLGWDANPTAEDMRVLVHFVDAGGLTAFTDDFAPATPTTMWSGRVSHTRMVTVPSSARGTYSVRVGLYQAHEPWERQPLTAASGVVLDDESRYAVATLRIDAPAYLPGTVVDPGGRCLEAYVQSYGYPLESGVSLEACTGAAAQVWTRQEQPSLALTQAQQKEQHRIISDRGRCVGIDADTALRLALCDGGTDQQWRFSLPQQEVSHD